MYLRKKTIKNKRHGRQIQRAKKMKLKEVKRKIRDMIKKLGKEDLIHTIRVAENKMEQWFSKCGVRQIWYEG